MQFDDITRRDLAKFDQFLDDHRDVADQLRRTPSLIDDQQYLQNHSELNAYLQDHPNVKGEISQHPDAFMRLEDMYDRDHAMRDRDSAWQGRDGDRDRDNTMQDRDRDRDGDRDRDFNHDRDQVDSFNQFMKDHREIAEQVRRNPSLLDNQRFIHDHPPLDSFLAGSPNIRELVRQNPNDFMHQEGMFAENAGYLRDVRDMGGDRGELENFNRFLDGHREIAEQLRKDPGLLDNQGFLHDHPELQSFLANSDHIRELVRQDPNDFMHQEGQFARNANPDHDPFRDHQAEFGGFLHDHTDVQRDMLRDPFCFKDRNYLQNHTDLDAYLNAHPDVRNDLMSDPQRFVQGAQQNGGSGTGNFDGSGVSGSGRASGTAGSTDMNTHATGTGTVTGTGTGTGTSTGTSTSTSTTTKDTNPKQ